MLASLTAISSNEPDGPFRKHLGSIFQESANAVVVRLAPAKMAGQRDRYSFLRFIYFVFCFQLVFLDRIRSCTNGCRGFLWRRKLEVFSSKLLLVPNFQKCNRLLTRPIHSHALMRE